MPSPYYNKVVAALSRHVGAKAQDILGRQLKHCGRTPENLAPGDLPAIANRLIGACSLYCSTDAARGALAEAIQGL